MRAYRRQDIGLLGVLAIDSFGDLVPPRQLDAIRDGAVGWMSRKGGQGDEAAGEDSM